MKAKKKKTYNRFVFKENKDCLQDKGFQLHPTRDADHREEKLIY
jgi:hypothetical protein